MATHKCEKIDEISTLKADQKKMADTLSEIKADIKEILKNQQN